MIAKIVNRLVTADTVIIRHAVFKVLHDDQTAYYKSCQKVESQM